VIIVDDRIATGATLFAAIEFCKKKKAFKIIFATPVSGERILKQLRELVDEVIIPVSPANYYEVSQVYQSFENLTDEDILNILGKYENTTE